MDNEKCPKCGSNNTEKRSSAQFFCLRCKAVWHPMAPLSKNSSNSNVPDISNYTLEQVGNLIDQLQTWKANHPS